VFFVVYFLYLTFVMGLGQRLVVWPLITVLPSRRRAVVGAWLRFNARATFRLARALAGVRWSVRGAIPAESVVVVMNHQSVLDIPLGIMLIPGPYPIIPTRDRYGRGIPGISPLTRLARFPLVTHRKTASREELLALRDVADQVARGEQSLLIFAEGHRTKGGSIDPFMKSGLKLILARARRPVYCIVADGMLHVPTFAAAAVRFAGTRVRAAVIGPFAVPADAAELDAFIDALRDRMIETLDAIRRDGAAPEPTAS
jgi:1-acyl-sn-glycerol-3-phosphate acyltransferase